MVDRLKHADSPEKLRQLVAEIPWGQNIMILERVKDPAARSYYLEATAGLGWTRNVKPRLHHGLSGLHRWHGK